MDLKIIEKSRKLLIQVMGQKDFDKFIENGKIEVVHGEGDDKIVYELDQDARVFNRSKQQSYCIEPICQDDLPVHDQLAIKYAYLKNNIKRVEEVANKRNTAPVERTPTRGLFHDLRIRLAGTGDTELQTRQRRYGQMTPRVGVSYDNYVEYMEDLGWRRSQLTVDEHNTHIISTYDVNSNCTGQIIDFRCPAGQKMTIMGKQQVPLGGDYRTAHTFRARISDENDIELPLQTKIRIVKENSTESVIQLARLFYGDISLTAQQSDDPRHPRLKTDDQWFRFLQGIELNGEEHLRVYIINSERNILARNIRMALDCDMWCS